MARIPADSRASGHAPQHVEDAADYPPIINPVRVAAGISVAIITVVLRVGTNLNTTFGSISTALK